MAYKNFSMECISSQQPYDAFCTCRTTVTSKFSAKRTHPLWYIIDSFFSVKKLLNSPRKTQTIRGRYLHPFFHFSSFSGRKNYGSKIAVGETYCLASKILKAEFGVKSRFFTILITFLSSISLGTSLSFNFSITAGGYKNWYKFWWRCFIQNTCFCNTLRLQNTKVFQYNNILDLSLNY